MWNPAVVKCRDGPVYLQTLLALKVKIDNTNPGRMCRSPTKPGKSLARRSVLSVGTAVCSWIFMLEMFFKKAYPSGQRWLVRSLVRWLLFLCAVALMPVSRCFQVGRQNLGNY